MTRIVALLVIALCATTALGQITYPIVCTGLPNNTNVNLVSWFYNYGSNSGVQYFFTRVVTGTQAFLPNKNLPAGSCTWLDRGVGTGEPAVLYYNIPTTATGNSQCYSQRAGNGFTCTALNPVAAAFISLAQGVNSRKTFNAYNTGNVFTITGLHATQY